MGLRFVDDKYFREGNILAFGAYFSNSAVEVSEVSFPLGGVITEFLNYDEKEYIAIINSLEDCYGKDDASSFLSYYQQAYDLVKQMPLYKDLLADKQFFKPPLIIDTKSFGEDDSDIIKENKVVMVKAMKTFIDLRDDLLRIKDMYSHLLEQMDDEMQKVNPSEKYEKAIAVPLLSEYFAGDALESPKEKDLARVYAKFVVKQSLSTGYMEIFERRIFNRLLSFIYLEFSKALMKQNMPKKCRNCGKYFLLENGFKNEYCTNPLPDNPRKTCRDVGAAASFKNKLNNPAWAVQQRAYKKYYARLMKGQMTKEEFDKWSEKSAVLRDKILENLEFMEFETYKSVLNSPENLNDLQI